MTDRLIVAITGASGPISGIRTLQLVRDEAPQIETHVILTGGARTTIALETDFGVDEMRSLADVVHSNENLAASNSSGSFGVTGHAGGPVQHQAALRDRHLSRALVARAAGVVLKERRRLVQLVRETPLLAGQVSQMLLAAQNRAIVMPPVPAFYHHPKTIEHVVDQTVGRALDHFGIATSAVRRWAGARLRDQTDRVS